LHANGVLVLVRLGKMSPLNPETDVAKGNSKPD